MDFLLAHPWLLAAAIFGSRILDVSLGTIRTITVVRGYRYASALIGFCEVILWVIAAGQVLKHMDRWYLLLAYAGGFATGTLCGIWLEGLLALGTVMVRVISSKPDVSLAHALTEQGYEITVMQGMTEPQAKFVEVILLIEQRRNVPTLIKCIDSADPTALFTIEDVRSVHNAKYPPRHKAPLFPTGWRAVFKKK
ncbi:MAG: DUF2179 domain-containing protein [Myxococcales bacterium]|nr:DUF2179 domain-containing protein [Myxococcales bacterium]